LAISSGKATFCSARWVSALWRSRVDVFHVKGEDLASEAGGLIQLACSLRGLAFAITLDLGPGEGTGGESRRVR
jgi:hypothetical protein